MNRKPRRTYSIADPTPSDVYAEAERQGVDPLLAVSIAANESGGNPRARSPKGARGLMQVMPATGQRLARELGEEYRSDDPAQNVRLGVRELRNLSLKYGTHDEVAAAYNAGPGAVDKHGGIPPYRETRAYVPKVQQTYTKLETMLHGGLSGGSSLLDEPQQGAQQEAQQEAPRNIINLGPAQAAATRAELPQLLRRAAATHQPITGSLELPSGGKQWTAMPLIQPPAQVRNALTVAPDRQPVRQPDDEQSVRLGDTFEEVPEFDTQFTPVRSTAQQPGRELGSQAQTKAVILPKEAPQTVDSLLSGFTSAFAKENPWAKPEAVRDVLANVFEVKDVDPETFTRNFYPETGRYEIPLTVGPEFAAVVKAYQTGGIEQAKAVAREAGLKDQALSQDMARTRERFGDVAAQGQQQAAELTGPGLMGGLKAAGYGGLSAGIDTVAGLAGLPQQIASAVTGEQYNPANEPEWVKTLRDLGVYSGALANTTAPDANVVRRYAGTAGSTLPFFLGGAAAGGGKLALGTIAAMGAGSQSAQGFSDALTHGASAGQVRDSALLNALLGTSEAAGMGGSIAKGIKSRAAREILGEGAEEFIQEGFTQGGGNVIAKDILGYDQPRSRTEGVLEGATVGGVLGLLTAGGMHGTAAIVDKIAKLRPAVRQQALNAAPPEVIGLARQTVKEQLGFDAAEAHGQLQRFMQQAAPLQAAVARAQAAQQRDQDLLKQGIVPVGAKLIEAGAAAEQQLMALGQQAQILQQQATVAEAVETALVAQAGMQALGIATPTAPPSETAAGSPVSLRQEPETSVTDATSSREEASPVAQPAGRPPRRSGLLDSLARQIERARAEAREFVPPDLRPQGEPTDAKPADLVKAVRKEGGLGADSDVGGELRRLGVKESGTTGVYNPNTGLPVDEVRLRMKSEGLTQAESVDDFVTELDDAIARRKNRQTRPEDDQWSDEAWNRHAEQWAEDREQMDAVDTILRADDEAARLAERTYRNEETPEERQKLWQKLHDAGGEAVANSFFVDLGRTGGRADHGRGQLDARSETGPNGEPSQSGAAARASQPKSIGPAELEQQPSQYQRLVNENKAAVNQLYGGLDLNTPEAQQLVGQLREYAKANQIAGIHVARMLDDVRNHQMRQAQEVDRAGVRKVTAPEQLPEATEMEAPEDWFDASDPDAWPEINRVTTEAERDAMFARLDPAELDDAIRALEARRNNHIRGQITLDPIERAQLFDDLASANEERKARVKRGEMAARDKAPTKEERAATKARRLAENQAAAQRRKEREARSPLGRDVSMLSDAQLTKLVADAQRIENSLADEKSYQGSLRQKQRLAAVERWRGEIERRKANTKPLVYQQPAQKSAAAETPPRAVTKAQRAEAVPTAQQEAKPAEAIAAVGQPESVDVRPTTKAERRAGRDAYLAFASGNQGGFLVVEGEGPTAVGAKEAATRKYQQQRASQQEKTGAPVAVANQPQSLSLDEAIRAKPDAETVLRVISDAGGELSRQRIAHDTLLTASRWKPALQYLKERGRVAEDAGMLRLVQAPKRADTAAAEQKTSTSTKPEIGVESAPKEQPNVDRIRETSESPTANESDRVPTAERERAVAQRNQPDGESGAAGVRASDRGRRGLPEREASGARSARREAAADRAGERGTEGRGDTEREPGNREDAANVARAEDQQPASANRAPDYVITDDTSITPGGTEAKLKANLAALRLVHQLRAEGRTPTVEEQHALAAYTGWGQFPDVFNEYNEGGRKRAAVREELKALLGPEGYERARASTLNAHYTAPQITRAMWRMAERLGFKGGRIVEPSVGVGNFFGVMPQELRETSKLTGVELDPTTAAIAQYLYPSANIQARGFETLKTPDGFFDFAIGNVPFGDYKLNDPRYNKHNARIHDYFFLKTVDQVRPGGLVMFITSTGTLDKLDSGIRGALAAKADLVGALRLPGQTFKANAGTDVVTDIIVLRRRADGEESNGVAWTGTKEVADPAGGKAMPVNEYFADHPEMILGTLDRKGTMYRGDAVNVSRTDDFEQRFERAIEALPQNVWSERQTQTKEFATAPVDRRTREGSTVIDKGQVFRVESGQLVPRKLTPKQVERVQLMQGLRDAGQAVLDAQRDSKGDVEALRRTLKSRWEGYTKKHGFLHERGNASLLAEDPDGPLILALEDWNAKTKTGTVAPLAITPAPQLVEPKTAGDAVALSLFERGKLDLDLMAKRLGQSVEDVGKDLVESGLAYHDPDSGWVTAAEYLSGNVRRKLWQAREAAAADPAFAPNVKALEKVQPADVDYGDIHVKLGAPWVPPSDVAAFITEMLEADESAVSVGYLRASGRWFFDFADNATGRRAQMSEAARTLFATKRVSFKQVVQSALTDVAIRIEDVIDSKTVAFNAEESAAANQKVKEIRERFAEWVWEDDERRVRLHRYYNDNFNNLVPMKYDAAHYRDADGKIRLPGMNPGIELRPAQANGIYRAVVSGKGIFGYEVGVGKTMTMLGAAMELKRLGLAKKNVLAVPKSVLPGFAAEARLLYPGAKILTTEGAFDADKRKRTIARIATGDWDMVIMTHDHLGFLGVRPEREAAFVEEQIKEVVAAVEEAKIAAKNDKGNRLVKELEKLREKLEFRFNEIIENKKRDDAVFFEDLGVDSLFVDEFHTFKSLPIYSQLRGIKGIPQATSDRAMDMLLKFRYISELMGGRNIFGATGTPVTNTVAEVYNLQRYFQPEMLKERGVDAFDAWAKTFGDFTHRVERTADGQYQPVTRFNQFSNLPELVQMTREMMDVVFASDVAEIKRPVRKEEVMRAEMSPEQTAFLQELQARAKAVRGGQVKPWEDNMLAIVGDARKSALDHRLVDPSFVPESATKIDQVVNNVLALHKEQPGKTQMIFSDLGVNPGKLSSFTVYQEIINRLVAGGIPRDKIINFSSDLTDVQRRGAAARLQEGDALIGIGGSTTMGTGVNAQRHLAALHHLDVPWLPAYLEQRDGRGVRQGNTNPNIKIYRYVTEGSFDSFMWQTVDAKSKFIRAFMKGDASARTIREADDETFSEAQIMAIASGNPRLLEKVQLDDDIAVLEQAERSFNKQKFAVRDSLVRLKEDIPRNEAIAAKIEADAEYLKTQEGGGWTVGGKEFETAEERGKALDEALAKVGFVNATTVAQYKGFDLTYDRINNRAYMLRDGGQRYEINLKLGEPSSTMASAMAVLRSLPKRAQDARNKVAQMRKDQAKLESQTNAEFTQRAELEEKRERRNRLVKEMKAEGKATEALPAAEAPAASRANVPADDTAIALAETKRLLAQAERAADDPSRVTLESLGLPETDFRAPGRAWAQSRRASVPVESLLLLRSQNLHPDVLLKYAQQSTAQILRELQGRPVKTIQDDSTQPDKFTVHDGNHRVASLLIRGYAGMVPVEMHGERGAAASRGNRPRLNEATPEQIIENAVLVVKPPTVTRPARIYANDLAMAVLRQALQEVYGQDYSGARAFNATRQQIGDIAEALSQFAQELYEAMGGGAQLAQMAQTMRDALSQYAQAQFSVVDASTLTSQRAVGLAGLTEGQDFRSDVREEQFHWAQREISGDSVALTGKSWAEKRLPAKYRKELLKRGYPADAEILAAEAAAQIAAGNFEGLGLRTDGDIEAALEWLGHYFERVAKVHGLESLDQFKHLPARAKEAREKGRSEQQRKQAEKEAEAGERAAADAGPPAGSRRRASARGETGAERTGRRDEADGAGRGGGTVPSEPRPVRRGNEEAPAPGEIEAFAAGGIPRETLTGHQPSLGEPFKPEQRPDIAVGPQPATQPPLLPPPPRPPAGDFSAGPQPIAQQSFEGMEPPADKLGALEIISAARKAGWLTGITTHLRNVIGNAGFQVAEEAARIPAAIADLLTSTVTRQRTVTGPAAKALARSSYAAATDGVKKAAHILKTGVPDVQAMQQQTRELRTRSRLFNGYVNGVFRLLAAEDQVFRTFALTRALEDRARSVALTELRAGKLERGQVKTRTQELVQNPPPDLMAGAIFDSEVATFNNDNKLSDAIRHGRAALPRSANFAVDLVMPFDRTPTNIIARILEYSPLGFAKAGRDLYRLARSVTRGAVTPDEQRAFARTFGRATIGSGLVALGWSLAAAGRLVGYQDDDSPQDFKKLAEMRKQGRAPLSIYVPATNTWHQIGQFSPLGNLLAIGATLYREGVSVGGVARTFGHVAEQQPLLNSLEELRKDWNRPEDAAGNMAASFVPKAVKDVGTLIDPTPRKARGFKEKFQRAVPLWKDQLPAQPWEARRSDVIDPTLTRQNRGPLAPELHRKTAEELAVEKQAKEARKNPLLRNIVPKKATKPKPPKSSVPLTRPGM